jgi:hypothetical protein
MKRTWSAWMCLLLFLAACTLETPPSIKTIPSTRPLPATPIYTQPAPTATVKPSQNETVEVMPADIVIDYDAILGPGHRGYGTNGWWTDEDADRWRERYAGLHPQVVRLPALQMILEPQNDNSDPATIDWAGFHFDSPFLLPYGGGRHVTYSRWFEMLRDLDVTLLINTPYLAGWLSANGNRDPYSSFPPADVAEYGEFVRALLTYLVDQVHYPPDQIILEPVNEADLHCGADPAVSCFWENWSMDDLVAVVRVAHDQAASINPAIRIAGLATCCDATLISRFMDEYKGSDYLDVITYHRYGRGFDFTSAIARGQELQRYGKPVYLDEFGSIKYWSNGEEGALWHSFVMPQIWAAGINPVQFPISEYPGTHQGYDQLGLFADWNKNWTIKPAYWVYANFYRHIAGGDPISTENTTPNLVLASRRDQTSTEPALALWLTAIRSEEFTCRLQIDNFPADIVQVAIYDNLQGDQPVEKIHLAGRPLVFELRFPSSGSFSVVVQP